MKNTRVIISLVFFLVMGGAIYLLAKPGGDSVQSAETTYDDKGKAPEFTLPDLDGKNIDLDDYSGKVIALNFWATWCGPCRKEIPDFVALQDQYAGDGLQVLGIALDQGGAVVVKPFAEKYKINYPVLIGNEDVTKKYGGMNAIPVTILVDRKGVIRGRFVGLRTKAALESLILPLLKEK